MSDYYDLFLALELKPDLTDEVLHEIRWHLRLTDVQPASFLAENWFYDENELYPVFTGTEPSHAFDGADVTALVPAPNRYGDGITRWQLTVRSFVHEDEYGFAAEVATWLARQSTSEGWIGYLRYSGENEPTNLTFDGTDIQGL